ncbi:hypothetical protein O6H91_17G077000 [Diphasiastrum complanatum]|uniref:Uncharacterized protein n=1 Tax=Diphasiastrum complanatum TaxID=34168 RepID=A0ACC2B8A9_DIPCM|nr:hypothetical protein O6H91_17G077000 [Diphasiastrum complanatum]
MHDRGEAEILAVLLSIIITVLVSFGIVYRVKARAARQIEILKLQRMVAAESARAEAAAVEEYTSMLASDYFCAVCQTPTKTRCSRCKAVRYCSATCQLQHWNQGHKLECKSHAEICSTVKSSDFKQDNDDTAPKTCSNGNIIKGIANENVNKNFFNRGFMQKTYDTVADTRHCNGIAKMSTTITFSKEDRQERSQDKVAQGSLDSAITVEGRLSNPKKILFSYDSFMKLFRWDMLRPPCGLINCGNSCFANVVLQCLTYTRPLAAYLLLGSHHQECQRNDWCFMCELQDHIRRVFRSEDAFSPIRILSRLRHIGNHLGYGRQEDAHEFMRFAIDSMQSICLDEAGGEKAVDIRSQETTIVQYIFGGHLQSQVKCMQCLHESNRYENMMDLTVEIQGPVESLEGALTQYTAAEWLDGDNKYKCDRCAAYVKARKRLTVHEAPNILTIALKRFQSGKFGKLNKRVTFPEVLDMSPYMSGKGDDPPLYRLYAVVVHVDMLNASFFGHYICYVKDKEGIWYKIDDSKVKEVDLDKVMSQNAYMLLYSRTSPRPGPTVECEVVPTTLKETLPLNSVVDHPLVAVASANIHDKLGDAVSGAFNHEPARSKSSTFAAERCTTSLRCMDVDLLTDDSGSLASNSSTSENDMDSSNNSSESVQSSLDSISNCDTFLLEKENLNNDSSLLLAGKFHGAQLDSNSLQNMHICNGETLGSAKRPHIESYSNGADMLKSPSNSSVKFSHMEMDTDELSSERVAWLSTDMVHGDPCTASPQSRTQTRLDDEAAVSNCCYAVPAAFEMEADTDKQSLHTDTVRICKDAATTQRFKPFQSSCKTEKRLESSEFEVDCPDVQNYVLKPKTLNRVPCSRQHLLDSEVPSKQLNSLETATAKVAQLLPQTREGTFSAVESSNGNLYISKQEACSTSNASNGHILSPVLDIPCISSSSNVKQENFSHRPLFSPGFLDRPPGSRSQKRSAGGTAYTSVAVNRSGKAFPALTDNLDKELSYSSLQCQKPVWN